MERVTLESGNTRKRYVDSESAGLISGWIIVRLIFNETFFAAVAGVLKPLPSWKENERRQ